MTSVSEDSINVDGMPAADIVLQGDKASFVLQSEYLEKLGISAAAQEQILAGCLIYEGWHKKNKRKRQPKTPPPHTLTSARDDEFRDVWYLTRAVATGRPRYRVQSMGARRCELE